MRRLHVVVPADVADPALVSGGNVYDRRLVEELRALGWAVAEHPVAGGWPRGDAGARSRLAGVLAGIDDGDPVLVDGLVASLVPEVLVPAASRLRLTVLMHLPVAADAAQGPGSAEPTVAETQAERAVLSASARVVATSRWTRDWLVRHTPVPADHVSVAAPGVDPRPLAAGTAAGGGLLYVAAVQPRKGHRVLVDALATLTELPWRCRCLGTLARDPAYAAELRRRIERRRLAERVELAGAVSDAEREAAYAAADVLVLASTVETYGMVVTEALAHGLPVVAAAAGGVPEALGVAGDGRVPGILVPPGDPAALAGALRSWCSDASLRQRLREAARERRGSLAGWDATARAVADAVAGDGGDRR